ncbi:PspC domain-containing protein [Streptomyces sp. NBC_00237]|uniref:PspC domain-containing protein n=1 Tax=Streptomyces sp. NBC_00237 TaxID=2975687 RepID=UPI002253279D|nr:PspC domain-containing protein [Streptomyces sp. NBC_00237]MCX5204744.1 PspC domain-containing protein [Streptomyces sp. NBC_00237]
MTEVHDAAPAAGSGAPSAAAPPAGESTPHRSLHRSRRHRTVGGVCGGLGEYFDVDPVIFRVVLAVTSVTGGIGLIAYGFAWLLVPLEGDDENEGKRLLTGRVDGPALIAVLLALVGCGMFLALRHNGGVFGFSVMLLLVVGASVVWSRQRRASALEEPGATQVQDVTAPPETKAPPIPGAPSWWRDPIVKDGTTGPVPHGYLWGPADEPVDGSPARRGLRPVDTRPRSFGGLTFVAAMLAGAAGTSATWQGSPLGTSLAVGLACALAVFGVGLVLASFLGRVGAGTIFLGLVTAGLLTVAATIPKNIPTEWATTDWRPLTSRQVQPFYELGAGQGRLDLSEVAVAQGTTVSTRVEVGAGALRVVVPKDATVRVDMEVGLGTIDLPGDNPDEHSVRTDQRQVHTLAPPPGTKPAGTIDLRLEVGLGQVAVERAAS